MRMQAPTKESSGAATQEEELMRALGQLTVQSTTTAAPQPTSLPNLWLHKLATYVSALLQEGNHTPGLSHSTVMAVFRTCTSCRDAVLLSRPVRIHARVPIHPEHWPAVLQRLCTVLGRSRNVWLAFSGPHAKSDWTETEPYIIHLLLCVRSKLGSAALTGIKAVDVQNLQQSALVPAWFRELCPSAIYLKLLRSGLPKVPSPLPAPAPHRSLQQLVWEPLRSVDTSAEPIRRHVRQQLAALPALGSLAARDLDWAARPALISSSVTRLVLFSSVDQRLPPPLAHLPAQFPNLRELNGLKYLIVRDDDLRTLLGLPHLRTLKVAMVEVSSSHRGRPWPQHLDLHLNGASVDALALLPLDSIPTCTVAESVIMPSSDAARAERVAAAFRRWGAFNVQRDGSVLLHLTSMHFAAALASLPPFLRAAPPQPITLSIVGAVDLTVAMARQLLALLTPNVSALLFTDTSFAPQLWPRLLPSLPPGVQVVHLINGAAPPASTPMVGMAPAPTMEQLRSLCLGAVRPVKVVVCTPGGPAAHVLVQRTFATMGNAAAARLVSLVAEE